MHRVVRASAVRYFTKQIRTNSTDAAITPRLATEFNGLVLPTQQELRENAAEDSSSRRAHDRTIEQRRKARLAREAAMTPRVQRDPTNSPDAALNALDIPKQLEDNSSGPRRRDPTIEQRREARLAREAARSANTSVKPRLASEFNGLVLPSQEEQDQHVGQRQSQQDPSREARRVAGRQQSASVPSEGEYGGRPARFGRRGSERLERLDVLGEFTVHTKKPKPKFNKRRDQGSRPDGSASATSSRTMARSKHRSPNSRRAVVAKSSLTDSPPNASANSEEYDCLRLIDEEDEGEEVEVYEDEGYEEDEEYEEDYSAEFNDPEHLSEDLADVFGPKLTPKEFAGALKVESTKDTPALTRHRAQYMLETLGGDYMRHSHVSFASPEQNDAVTQAQLVLSKIKTIDLNQKQTLLGIVQSSVRKRSKALRRV